MTGRRTSCGMCVGSTSRSPRDVLRELAPRSAYVLSGRARWSWQHSIPATNELRYSVTFRTLKRSRDAGGSRTVEG
jgi:alkylated DNA repair dioxygenase AlkB